MEVFYNLRKSHKISKKKKISMHNDIHVSGIFERSFIILQQAHEWRSPRKQFMWNSDKLGTTERTRGIVIVFIRISRDQSRQLQKQKLWRLILPLDGVDVHTIDQWIPGMSRWDTLFLAPQTFISIYTDMPMCLWKR